MVLNWIYLQLLYLKLKSKPIWIIIKAIPHNEIAHIDQKQISLSNKTSLILPIKGCQVKYNHSVSQMKGQKIYAKMEPCCNFSICNSFSLLEYLKDIESS